MNSNVIITFPVSLMNSDNYQNMNTMKATLKIKHVMSFIKGAVPTLKG